MKRYETNTNAARGIFIQHILNDLDKGIKHNKKSVEKLGASLGIFDKTEIKEYTELAIVYKARIIARLPVSIGEKYELIVKLYESQVNLSHRTSQSILLQQYSTPAPISFLAGIFANADQDVSVFEPSAGNGLLTIAAHPANVIVNEVDTLRRSNLDEQGYKQVLKQDASLPFRGFEKKFDTVLTNPPFGILEQKVKYETYGIKALDHLMALRALDTMKDNGKAAIVIGGHNRYDSKGRFQKGGFRFFFNYLYSRYHVADLLNISGRKLFSRQGTSFNIRLILIAGRKAKPAGAAPIANAARDKVVDSFEELYERVMGVTENRNDNDMRRLEIEAEALALELELMHFDTLSGMNPYGEKIDYDKLFARYLELRPAFPNETILLLETIGTYITFNENARTVSGKVKGIKRFKSGKRSAYTYSGIEIRKSDMWVFFQTARMFGWDFFTAPNGKQTDWEKLEHDELGMPYNPASDACIVLDTVVPDSMGYETHGALDRIKEAVGGDMDEYVRKKLNYKTKTELCKALSAEQIDAVAMAIYNIEERGQGMIIGDQTGIGKGRVAASVIRYGVEQGVQPIFITEKANLFSDIYRDLVAIGSEKLVPFIVNGRESKTDIKDEDGEVVHQALAASEQQRIFKDQQVPARYDFVVGTYSQFNSPEKKPEKPMFLNAIAEDTIVIMDEAHNSSGSSNVGNFMQSVLSKTRGVVFLSATFAKRPDNMPIYAMKTAISEANMTRDELVEAITKGGVALQEVLASQLVAEGQMLRRERSFEGVEVNYITLSDKEQEHKAIADNITEILRDIIAFQGKHVDEAVEAIDDISVAEGKQVEIREGTSQAGVDNLPYFSKVFNVINQMLFSIKAESVAERAIMRLKEGKKPVIAFASTMGSFIEQMETDSGMAVSDGDTINADFSEVLQKGLDGILRYTETDVDGNKLYKKFDLTEFSPEAQAEYLRIAENITSISTGITISPIDVVVQKLKQAGYTVAEVTGRKYELQLSSNGTALVATRKKINTNDAFRQFNNNEVDVLLINQSGSTGASAHAIVTPKVPKEKVRQRVMIVLQAELDINTEVQKRGRINRTGQILKPIYDYVNSAIPAEMRLMMMLQKKLKSLDANTTSNQKSSTKILDVPDFLNKYGDRIVAEYLTENPEINLLLDDPIGIGGSETQETIEDAAHKVSGRVAVLSTKMQQEFYNEVSTRYTELVEYLKQIDEYDLEVEAMNLEAETISERVIKVGKGGQSEFGDDSMLETVMANVLRKPFTTSELENLITESLHGKDARAQQTEIKEEYDHYVAQKLEEDVQENTGHYESAIKEIPNEKKLKKIQEKEGQAAYLKKIKEREQELLNAQKLSDEKIRKSYANRQQYLNDVFDFFYTGKNLNYPVSTMDGEERIFSVFLGFIIDKKKKNPYVPSAIRLRFAIGSSKKYIAIPANYTKDINAIKGVSIGVTDMGKEKTLERWEASVKESVVDRKIRHVITGNLLQAFSDFKGKLVSYTTIDGGTKKGILMPESWNPGEEQQQKVTVPISRAVKIIRSMTTGSQITTNNGVSLFKQPGRYKIIVSASRSKAGDIYLDSDILNLVDNNNFERVSSSMTAMVDESKVDKLITLLQDKFSSSVSLNTEQFSLIKNDLPKRPLRERPVINVERKQRAIPEVQLPPPPSEIELEAMALELELELLSF